MAIQIFCTDCKTSNGLDAKKCSKCGKVFCRKKKYRVCVSVKGKRVTRVVDNLAIAQETESAIKADLFRGEFDITLHKTDQTPKLDEIWKQYLEWARANKAKSWQTDGFFYRKHLQPRFGKKPLNGISSFDIEKMKSQMKQQETPQGKKGYSDATIRHVLVLLGHLYKKAALWKKYTGENPVDGVKKPKLDNKITEFLTPEEMEKLIETLDEWPCRESANFVRIGLYTGIRKGEIMKLKWQDVHLERRALTLRDPKGGVTATIPLSDEAASVFSDIPRIAEYVLPGPDGKMKRTFRDPWYKIREAAGLPEGFRYHGLRHNLASHLVSNGVDLFTVSKLLCHKDIRTSERYSRLSDESLRRAADLGGKLLAPKAPAKVISIEQS